MSTCIDALPTPVIALCNVSKTFVSAAGEFTALRDVSFSVECGEFVVISGQSGSGKSTLLALLAGIDRPSSGAISVGGTSIASMSESATSKWRGDAVGIVFQFFQLLPTLTAIENVMLPMDFRGMLPGRVRRARAASLLERLGVADQADKLPVTLSGGQQQRVAIARSLANAPAVVLADEPTGNLDSKNAHSILTLLRSLAHEGQTVVMVTHDRTADAYGSRGIELQDGSILKDVSLG